MRLLIIIFLLILFNVKSQDKGNFTFEIEVNQIHYNQMDVYNRYLKDTTGYASIHFGDTYLKDTLRKSTIYGLSLNYQLCNFMDFGIYGSYQGNTFGRNYKQVTYLGGTPYYYVLEKHQMEINNTSYVFGVLTTVYLNKILNFENYNSTFLKRSQVGIGFKLGYSKSSFEEISWVRYYDEATSNEIFTSSGNASVRKVTSESLIGNVELKLGYRLIDKRFFSTVGMKIGYQFYSSKVFRDKDTRSTFNFGVNKEEMRLNFSGLYYGVYLNFGKK